jgi:hypothetical protein
MSYKQLILDRYGSVILTYSNELRSFKNKLSSAKNHVIFLERCKHHNLILSFLNNRCPIKTPRAERINNQYKFNLLKESLYNSKRTFHQLVYKIDSLTNKISRTVVDLQDFELIKSVTNKQSQVLFIRHKNRLRLKFEKLKSAYRTYNDPTAAKRVTTIKKSVLQLQENPLNETQLKLLSKGPKFVPFYKKAPTLEIAAKVERIALHEEKAGRADNAEHIRQATASVLKQVVNKKLKDNLTREERKELNELRRSNISVVPYDKGIGFCTIEEEKLKEKVFNEFDNVELNSKNGTKSLENRIKKTLKRLLNEEKRK